MNADQFAISELMKKYDEYRQAYIEHFGTEDGLSDGFTSWLREQNGFFAERQQ